MKTKKRTIHPKWYIFLGLLLAGILVRYFCIGYAFSGFLMIAIAFWIPVHHLITLISNVNWKKGLLIMESIILASILIAMTVTGALIIRSSRGTKHPNADYLIVLGAGVNGTTPSLSLQERLNATIQYLGAHPNATAIVSGGQGNGEDITEAQCMYQYLTDAGVSPDRVWMEPLATNTLENLQFSMDIIENRTGVRPKKAAIVSSEYHLHRAAMFARWMDLEPELVPATTSKIPLRINYFLREIFAVWYYGLFGGYRYAR